jgi:hypothetical protein
MLIRFRLKFALQTLIVLIYLMARLRRMALEIQRIRSLPTQSFTEILAESKMAGFRAIERLVTDWETGVIASIAQEKRCSFVRKAIAFLAFAG